MILETKKEKLSLEVQGVKFFKQFVIVKFKGIDNINDIEQYKGCSLLSAVRMQLHWRKTNILLLI